MGTNTFQFINNAHAEHSFESRLKIHLLRNQNTNEFMGWSPQKVEMTADSVSNPAKETMDDYDAMTSHYNATRGAYA